MCHLHHTDLINTLVSIKTEQWVWHRVLMWAWEELYITKNSNKIFWTNAYNYANEQLTNLNTKDCSMTRSVKDENTACVIYFESKRGCIEREKAWKNTIEFMIEKGLGKTVCWCFGDCTENCCVKKTVN